MFKRFLNFFLILPILFSLSGCVYLVVGGIGALGGYIVSPDTVEGITEHDEIAVWDATVEIVSVMGLVEQQSEESGFIQARINGATVSVMIVR